MHRKTQLLRICNGIKYSFTKNKINKYTGINLRKCKVSKKKSLNTMPRNAKEVLNKGSLSLF